MTANFIDNKYFTVMLKSGPPDPGLVLKADGSYLIDEIGAIYFLIPSTTERAK